ncbi:hypothetical protein [Imhoffiella purpurea]|uniref:Plasmid related protein n=1 Tax=Imhoffiella purpurea TaxID=1249627 RepID=W9UYH3_9GAMM|nr:hypothetical protein [Imhoffiella purpurea]EXJ12278.1 plasmid related protein [Imhoffiella purpurea]
MSKTRLDTPLEPLSAIHEPSLPTDSMNGPLFPLGRLMATPSALATLESHGVDSLSLLQRHVRGDWGDLTTEDIEANRLALREGFRLLSSYRITDGVKVWIITEADRSVTTVLLPEDY